MTSCAFSRRPASLSRVVFTGKLGGAALRDACAAMTVFAFSSTSETQGLVLAEAMAAGAPVVALDASGVREVVVDGSNGHLLPADTLGGALRPDPDRSARPPRKPRPLPHGGPRHGRRVRPVPHLGPDARPVQPG
jgi:hypothetical protein